MFIRCYVYGPVAKISRASFRGKLESREYVSAPNTDKAACLLLTLQLVMSSGKFMPVVQPIINCKCSVDAVLLSNILNNAHHHF